MSARVGFGLKRTALLKPAAPGQLRALGGANQTPTKLPLAAWDRLWEKHQIARTCLTTSNQKYLRNPEVA
jgi:hypothetical protein